MCVIDTVSIVVIESHSIYVKSQQLIAAYQRAVLHIFYHGPMDKYSIHKKIMIKILK